MKRKEEKQVTVLTYRLNEIRKKKLEKLKNLELFSNTDKISKIFDFLIDSALEHPERFKSSIIDSEVDIFKIVKDTRESQIKFNNDLVDVLEELFNKFESVENKLTSLLTEKKISDLKFSSKIKRGNNIVE